MLSRTTKTCPKSTLAVVNRLLWSVVPAIATTAIAAAPSLAATFASSQGLFEFSNFSENALSTSTFTDTDSLTIATGDGSSTALAQSEAHFLNYPLDWPCPISFIPNSPNYSPCSLNIVASQALGVGQNYFGAAQSFAQVVGTFFIEEDRDFSFDFSGMLNLATVINNPNGESAKASTDISFLLFDSTDSENVSLLDFLRISGSLSTPGENDFLAYQNSDNVTADYLTDTGFGGTEEFAALAVNGSFKRKFSAGTHLTLVEYKVSQVAVKAPEPSVTFGFLLFGLVGFGLKSRRNRDLELQIDGTEAH